MELDFKSIKALSSPTRIQILNQVLEKEATPTTISKDIEKTKSTVSSHLTKLEQAGLVEKDKEEGRKRVTYRPTGKAEAIVKGKERRVKFSVASSAVSGLAALSFGFSSLFSSVQGGLSRSGDLSSYSATSSDKLGAESLSESSKAAANSTSDGVQTLSQESINQTAEKAAEAASQQSQELINFTPKILLYIGLLFFGIALLSGLYGWMMNQIGS